MIHTIYMKTPDALLNTLDDVFPHLKDDGAFEGRAKLKSQLERFIQYGENVTLLFDSEKNEMTVKLIGK